MLWFLRCQNWHEDCSIQCRRGDPMYKRACRFCITQKLRWKWFKTVFKSHPELLRPEHSLERLQERSQERSHSCSTDVHATRSNANAKNYGVLLLYLTSAVGLSIAWGILLSSCGKQEFRKTEFSEAAAAIGSRTLPAKVDIVLVPDNSASLSSAFNIIQDQLSQFISKLDNENWDYHVAKSYMINPDPIRSVLVNPKYNSTTLPDGTPNPSASLVPTTAAIDSLNLFLPIIGRIDQSTGSRDETYANTYNKLFEAMNNSTARNLNLFRQDALLAIIILTNGAEYSIDPYHDSTFRGSFSLSYWAERFRSLKTLPQLLRFYPVAASSARPRFAGDYCHGSTAYNGASYTNIVPTYLPGLKFDFCDSSVLSNVFTEIASHLSSIRQNFIFSKIVLEQEPVASTIKVYKNGNLLSQDNTNGWTYLGGPQTVSIITGIEDSNGQIQPFNANARTGWVIELHGSAVLRGNDTYNVDYSRP